MTDLSERLAGLTPQQREALLRRVAEKKQAGKAIRRRDPALVEIPLSFAQQRLWFLHQLEPESAVNNLFLPHIVRGSLDVKALERSLTELVARHESLRTTFGARDGQPFQIVQPPAAASLVTIDVPIDDPEHLEERVQ